MQRIINVSRWRSWPVCHCLTSGHLSTRRSGTSSWVGAGLPTHPHLPLPTCSCCTPCAPQTLDYDGKIEGMEMEDADGDLAVHYRLVSGSATAPARCWRADGVGPTAPCLHSACALTGVMWSVSVLPCVPPPTLSPRPPTRRSR